MPIHRPIDTPPSVRKILTDETLMPDERFLLIEALFVPDAGADEWERPRRALASETVRVRRRRATPTSHDGRSGRGRADRNAGGE
jgi:hypothetical protein